MVNIRTKWHKLMTLIERDDEVYYTAPKDGMALHWDNFETDKDAFKWLMRQIDKHLPKFVVDKDLLDLVMAEGYEKSLLDMRKAGVLRSPFPAMIIEFDLQGNRHFVMLRDNQSGVNFEWEAGDVKKIKHPFYGMVMRVSEDKDGEYAIVSPSLGFLNIEDREGEPWIGISSTNLDFIKRSPKTDELIKSTWIKDAAALYRGMATAALVMYTKGVNREVVDCSKINRTRIASNKAAIPRHTYLSIGKVYRSSSSEVADDYVPRKSPRPHWRQGHLQTVHYGPKRTLTKQVYIDPKLVAIADRSNDEPSMGKTYVVKK